MKCIISISTLMVLLACAGGPVDEPVYEWSLKYMVREIPEGLKESLEDVSDYSKNKKEFKELISVSIITNGLSESMATVSSKTGVLTFAAIPDGKGAISFYGAFQKDARTGKPSVVSTRKVKEIVYNNEIELGSSAYVKGSKKPGQLGKGEAYVFLLVVRKVDIKIPQLAKNSVEVKGAEQK